jgi:hypothetical protein
MIPTRTTDFRLAQIEATLRLEGLMLDKRTRALLRRELDGEISHKQAREELLARHRPVVRGS